MVQMNFLNKKKKKKKKKGRRMGVFLNQAHKGCERGNFNFVQVKYASFKETDRAKNGINASYASVRS